MKRAIATLLLLVATQLQADKLEYNFEEGDVYAFTAKASFSGDADLPLFVGKMLVHSLGANELPKEGWTFDLEEKIGCRVEVVEVDLIGNKTVRIIPNSHGSKAHFVINENEERDVALTQEGTMMTFIVSKADQEISRQSWVNKPLEDKPMVLIIGPDGYIKKLVGSSIDSSISTSKNSSTGKNGDVCYGCIQKWAAGELSWFGPFINGSEHQINYSVGGTFDFEITQERRQNAS